MFTLAGLAGTFVFTGTIESTCTLAGLAELTGTLGTFTIGLTDTLAGLAGLAGTLGTFTIGLTDTLAGLTGLAGTFAFTGTIAGYFTFFVTFFSESKRFLGAFLFEIKEPLNNFGRLCITP